jgi:DNA-binding MarR family transcriptional regulator
MKSINGPEQLLLTFAGLFENSEFEDFAIKVSAPIGKRPELRVKAQNNKLHLPILVDLYPSRKVLDGSPGRERKPFLLLSPHIPVELARDLRKKSVNHADLNGRLYLKTPHLLLDREPRDQQYRGPAQDVDLFSLKTSRIIRTLLSHRKKNWHQSELVKQTKTSPGLVSRILKALLQNDYVKKEPDSKSKRLEIYTLKNGERLLEAWRFADNWKKRVNVHQYSMLTNDPTEIAKILQDNLDKKDLAFTQWFAGFLRFPYTTPPVVSAYIRKEQIREIQFARKVTGGGNLWLIVPEDEGVFLETRKVDGFQIVSDIQIYLDLIQVGQRGPDQAEALRKWEGFNK